MGDYRIIYEIHDRVLQVIVTLSAPGARSIADLNKSPRRNPGFLPVSNWMAAETEAGKQIQPGIAWPNRLYRNRASRALSSRSLAVRNSRQRSRSASINSDRESACLCETHRAGG